MAKTPTLKLPTNPADLADLLFARKAQASALSQQVKAFKVETDIIKDHLIGLLRKKEMVGVVGENGKATLRVTLEPQVDDWEDLRDYIVKHRAFELLEKRLSKSAAAERHEAGKKVPGVSWVESTDLSITQA